MSSEEIVHRLNRIRLMGGLVWPIAFDAGKAEGETGGIARRFLDVAEGNFYDQFWAHEHRVTFTVTFQCEQLFGLQAQHVVGQSFKRLAKHDELTCLRIAGAEMEIREPAFPSPISPFGGKHDEVEGRRLLELEPMKAPLPCDVGSRKRFGHNAFVARLERLSEKAPGLIRL